MFFNHAKIMEPHINNIWVLSYPPVPVPEPKIVDNVSVYKIPTQDPKIVDNGSVPNIPMPDAMRICVLYSRCNTTTPEKLPDEIDKYTYTYNIMKNTTRTAITTVTNVKKVINEFKDKFKLLMNLYLSIHSYLCSILSLIRNGETNHVSDHTITSSISAIYNIIHTYSDKKANTMLKDITTRHDNYMSTHHDTIQKFINNCLLPIYNIPIFDDHMQYIYDYILKYILCFKNITKSKLKALTEHTNTSQPVDTQSLNNTHEINIYQKMLELYRSAWCAANLAELVLYVVKTNPSFPAYPTPDNIYIYNKYIIEVMHRYQSDSKLLPPVLYYGLQKEQYINYGIKWSSSEPAHYIHIMKYLNTTQKQYCRQYIDYYKNTNSNTDINAKWVDEYVDIAETLVDNDKALPRSR